MYRWGNVRRRPMVPYPGRHEGRIKAGRGAVAHGGEPGAARSGRRSRSGRGAALQTRSWRGRGAARSGSGRGPRARFCVDGGCGPSQTLDVERGGYLVGYLVGAAVDVDANRAPLDPGAARSGRRS